MANIPTKEQREKLEQRRKELDTKLRMHNVAMSNSFGEYNRKQKELYTSKDEPKPDLENGLTPKAKSISKKVSNKKSITKMESNPIVSSMISSDENEETKSENDVLEIKQIDKTVNSNLSKTSKKTSKRKNNKKDPNYTTVSPGFNRPLKINDTVSDILGKVYNFMFVKYIKGIKLAGRDEKYRRLLRNVKERRIEELIGLFSGKYKKQNGLDNGKPKLVDKKTLIDHFKDITRTVIKQGSGLLNAGKNLIKGAKPTASTVAKVGAGAAAVSSLTEAMGGQESGGNYDITFADRVDPKTGKIKNIKGYKTPEDLYNKKLTEMSLSEVKEFGKKRSAVSQNSGAVGKYGFMPSTLFGRTDKHGKHVLGLVEQMGLSMDTPFNADTQEQIQNFLQKQNITQLKNQGVAITPGNTYMAQYIGATGAGAVHRAIEKGENKTVAQAMIDEKLNAPGKENNPELYNIKVSEFEGVLANRLKKHGYKPQETPIPENKKQQIPEQMKKDNSQKTSSISIMNNNTNVINGSTNMAINNDMQPAYPSLIEKQYYQYG